MRVSVTAITSSAVAAGAPAVEEGEEGEEEREIPSMHSRCYSSSTSKRLKYGTIEPHTHLLNCVLCTLSVGLSVAQTPGHQSNGHTLFLHYAFIPLLGKFFHDHK